MSAGSSNLVWPGGLLVSGPAHPLSAGSSNLCVARGASGLWPSPSSVCKVQLPLVARVRRTVETFALPPWSLLSINLILPTWLLARAWARAMSSNHRMGESNDLSSSGWPCYYVTLLTLSFIALLYVYGLQTNRAAHLLAWIMLGR